LVAADGISIPYWNWIGNTVVTDDYIRLTPDRQTKRGAVWNTVP
jgi:mannose-binding lectin 2